MYGYIRIANRYVTRRTNFRLILRKKIRFVREKSSYNGYSLRKKSSIFESSTISLDGHCTRIPFSRKFFSPISLTSNVVVKARSRLRSRFYLVVPYLVRLIYFSFNLRARNSSTDGPFDSHRLEKRKKIIIKVKSIGVIPKKEWN